MLYYVSFICIKIIINSGIIKAVITTEVEFRVLLSVTHYFISHHIKLKPCSCLFFAQDSAL